MQHLYKAVRDAHKEATDAFHSTTEGSDGEREARIAMNVLWDTVEAMEAAIEKYSTL